MAAQKFKDQGEQLHGRTNRELRDMLAELLPMLTRFVMVAGEVGNTESTQPRAFHCVRLVLQFLFDYKQ